jgi:hypothetical protein
MCLVVSWLHLPANSFGGSFDAAAAAGGLTLCCSRPLLRCYML